MVEYNILFYEDPREFFRAIEEHCNKLGHKIVCADDAKLRRVGFACDTCIVRWQVDLLKHRYTTLSLPEYMRRFFSGYSYRQDFFNSMNLLAIPPLEVPAPRKTVWEHLRET